MLKTAARVFRAGRVDSRAPSNDGPRRAAERYNSEKSGIRRLARRRGGRHPNRPRSIKKMVTCAGNVRGGQLGKIKVFSLRVDFGA